MASERVNITSPVGRMVMGSFYKPNTTDFDGKPLVTKTGANAGQPRVQYFFGLAIPKVPGHTHWSQTDWGSQIWAVGHREFPQAAQRPDFAWKIEDGDSTIPNKRNKIPRDNEGWPGHWILKFTGGFAPKIYQAANGAWEQVTQENFIKPGYFIQAAFSVDGNGNQNNPGVYLNHSMVCFSAYGPEISFGPDVNAAGFGNAPLPAGASLVPLASTQPPPAPSLPQYAGMPPAPPVAAPPVPPVPVTPNPGFVQMPPAPAVPLPTGTYPVPVVPVPPTSNAIPASPSSPGYQMTAKAAGSSREAFLAAGWTDAALIQNGFMTV